jgi:hypothetical protein
MTDATKAARRAAARLEVLAYDLRELRLDVQLEGDRGSSNPRLEDRLHGLQDEADRCLRRIAHLAWALGGDNDDDDDVHVEE